MTFEPGKSGNPNGRPRGIRNRRTIVAEKLFDENAEKLTNLTIQLAEQGNFQALRLCMDRICPRAKHSPIAFDIPPVKSSTDGLGAMGAIVQGVGDGELTPAEANDLGKLVRNTSLVAVETSHDERINKLEEAVAQIEKDK